MALIRCEECGAEVSDEAMSCPKCGYPMRGSARLPFWLRTGIWGYEWKSETTILGWPLVHIAFGWNMKTGQLMMAKGIIAIGQFAFGLFTLAQFGVGLLIGVGQFIAGTFVVGQFALGILFAFGQFAVGHYAMGQFAAGRYVRALVKYRI
jgi:ribosomal protein L37E